MPEDRSAGSEVERDSVVTDCLYCTEEHTAEQRGTVALISAMFGHLIRVTVIGEGEWLVPREYIALHGLHAVEVPLLAAVYDWSKVG